MDRRAHGEHGQQRGKGERPMAQLHEADVGIVGDELKKFHGFSPGPLNVDFGRALGTKPARREQAGEGHGGEHAGRDADQ